MRRAPLVLVAALAVLLAGMLVVRPWTQPTGCAGAPPGSCTRVLFIGNSYTFVNDLPGRFAALAHAGGHRTEVAMVANGGATLAGLLTAKETADALVPERWDDVVLQEQSEVPSVATARTQVMYPAVRTFADRIRIVGARTILFLTWAHRDGWPENGLPSYGTMQDQVTLGYLAIGHELGAPVAPVGVAWSTALREAPQVTLWAADGSHPGPAGTYLAACVFYATVFHASPEGLAVADGVSGADGRTLQSIAARVVLGDPARWNLP